MVYSGEQVIFVGRNFTYSNRSNVFYGLVAGNGYVDTDMLFIDIIETGDFANVDLKVDLLFDHEKKKITILNISGKIKKSFKHELMNIISTILRVYYGSQWKLQSLFEGS